MGTYVPHFPRANTKFWNERDEGPIFGALGSKINDMLLAFRHVDVLTHPWSHIEKSDLILHFWPIAVTLNREFK